MQASSQTRVGLVLRPGQRGTKKLLKQFGEEMVCVRYRYDEASGKRYKTIELVVEEKDWQPSAGTRRRRAARAEEAQTPEQRWEGQHLVTVEVPATRSDIHAQLREIGARPEKTRPNHWRLPFPLAIRLRLRKFIQTNAATRDPANPQLVPREKMHYEGPIRETYGEGYGAA